MQKGILSAQERAEIENTFSAWQKDEIWDLQLTALPKSG